MLEGMSITAWYVGVFNMYRAVSEAVAASLAEATPDSLGSRNYCRAAGAGMTPATQRRAADQGYPGTRHKLATGGMMHFQNR